ncbi:glycosyl hydrolase [Dactylosporangium sp. NPDC005572]|uniref:glycosyl hydrolase n=1 Tax=Dactylosporangium sp. NPDC005572 TaxID=3156889 RepID=UPI0033AB0F63
MSSNISRRRLLQAGGATAGATLLGTSGLAAVPAFAHTGSGGRSADWFTAPDAATRAQFRWWWPGAHVDTNEIAREVHQIADAGFGGFEIADVYDSVSAPMDPAVYGWGTPRWNAAVETALATAKQRGLLTSITIGPHWPSAVPGVLPDSAAGAKELTHGRATVEAGASFSGPVPLPTTSPSGTSTANPNPPVSPVLVRLFAAQVTTATLPASGPVELVQGSLTDLTGRVANGAVSWTAPAGGNPWVLIAIWQRGTGQIVNMFDGNPNNSPVSVPQAYVVDHFGREGADVVVRHWERDLLTARILRLLRDTHGSIFEDSLELKTVKHWTPGLPKEFQRRRGYAVEPLLPIVLAATPQFTYPGVDTTRVRRDYDQTLSDLWIDNRLKVFVDWTESRGLFYKNQGYGTTVDVVLSAALTGQAEGESLGFGVVSDGFRALASGRDLSGHPDRKISDELGAFSNRGYRTTWQDMLETANGNFVSGVNEAVLHGFAYAAAPGTLWPGFAAFSPFRNNTSIGFAEAWGPRQPTWKHIRDVSGYLARTQAVLQAGKNTVDLAFYRQDFNRSGGYFTDTSLLRAGYSTGYLSHGVLDLPTAVVRQRRLAPAGPSYKAFIVNNQATMPLKVAKQILSFARDGLPIIVVGTPPGAVPGYFHAAADDAALQLVVAQLLAQPTVKQAAASGDVLAALQSLGVRPSAANARAADVYSVRRRDDHADYYFLHNISAAAEELDVSLEGDGVPHTLDPWTGAITPIARYDDTQRGRVTVHVRIGPKDAILVALQERGKAPSVHAVTADVDVRYDGDRLVARSSTAGTFTVTLPKGRTAKVAVPGVPAPIPLTSWRLSVEDWQPTNPTADDMAATLTTKTTLPTLTLNSLQPWPQLADLQDASGIGTYTTTVTLPADWNADLGATLSLGEVLDTFRVTVNGTPVGPVNQLSTTVDIGRWLKPGANTITVEVATTLNNRLRITRPTPWGGQSRQAYGLVGPAMLTPYRETQIRT